MKCQKQSAEIKSQVIPFLFISNVIYYLLNKDQIMIGTTMNSKTYVSVVVSGMNNSYLLIH